MLKRKKIFKEKESIEILKVLGLINNIEEHQKYIIMFEENVSQEFRLKNINEIRDYLIEERNQNELMSKKQEKVCTTLIYTEHFLVLASTITGFVFTATFASLIGIPLGITNSAITLKICATTAGIKKYKSIIKKNKKKYDKIVLLAKSKLN